MSTQSDILKLTKQLYPNGRAFKIPPGGILERLHQALAISEAQAFDDALGTLDSLLPDNSNFTADDATAWERRLGIPSGEGTTLADRKLAIKRKINHPGEQPCRQHYLFVEAQLRLAGFDVHVYENNFDDGMGGREARSPQEVIGLGLSGAAEMADEVEMGTVEMGGLYTNVVANYIEDYKDALFNYGTHYKNTFFISGPTVDTFADVPEVRKTEFRELVLKLKPLHTVAILFINYTT